MKSKQTLQMEQALIDYELDHYRNVALEVPFYHTKPLTTTLEPIQPPDFPTYREVGELEIIDAVSEGNGHLICYELKVSFSDLHSKAAQSYLGNDNYLVCPLDMATKILEKKDSWLKEYPNVGIKAWDGKSKFKIIKRSKSNYSLHHNDVDTLYRGMIHRMGSDIKMYRNLSEDI